MAYYLVRLYSGSADRPAEELLQNVVANELLPKLQEGGGLQRYITGILEDRGGIVSASVYDSRQNAEKGLEIARQWVADTSSLRGYQLSNTLRGEIVGVSDGDSKGPPRFGIGRIYSTSASAEQCLRLMQQHGPNTTKGRTRTVVVQLEDNRVGTFSSYESEQARTQHTEAVHKMLAENEDIKRVLTNAPEEIRVCIVTST